MNAWLTHLFPYAVLPHKSGSRGAAPGMFHVEISAPVERLKSIEETRGFPTRPNLASTDPEIVPKTNS